MHAVQRAAAAFVDRANLAREGRAIRALGAHG
jgi:hypothetical protein